MGPSTDCEESCTTRIPPWTTIPRSSRVARKTDVAKCAGTDTVISRQTSRAPLRIWPSTLTGSSGSSRRMCTRARAPLATVRALLTISRPEWSGIVWTRGGSPGSPATTRKETTFSLNESAETGAEK